MYLSSLCVVYFDPVSPPPMFIGFTPNPLCGARYSGPADKSTDAILTFSCQSLLGRFVSVQKSGSNVSLSIAHVKIDTAPNGGNNCVSALGILMTDLFVLMVYCVLKVLHLKYI